MSEKENKVAMIEHELPETKKETAPKEVVVSTEKLDKVMDRLDVLEKENELLKKSVSSSKYKLEQEKLDRDKVMKVKFKLHNGVPIVGLKSLEQRIVANPVTGHVTANAIIRYSFLLADGTEVEKPYQDFYTTIEHTDAHVVANHKEKDHQLYSGKLEDSLIFTCEFIDQALNEKYGHIDVPVCYVNM